MRVSRLRPIFYGRTCNIRGIIEEHGPEQPGYFGSEDAFEMLDDAVREMDKNFRDWLAKPTDEGYD